MDGTSWIVVGINATVTVGAICFAAGRITARLKTVEDILTNGLPDEVKRQGEEFAELRGHCKTMSDRVIKFMETPTHGGS